MSDPALRQQLQIALAPTYVIERELAGGGMARVFVAEETRFRRHVVVKVLPPELAAELSAERFERELAVAAGLQQANIVPVLTAGDLGGIPWYTMPFVEGESLRARIARGTLPMREAIRILADVARALAYAHAHGIVHRDVKPENVLLSSGTAVVTDFGIAKALAASKTDAGSVVSGATLTQGGTALGTPAYMAPEQAAGDDVDARADLYAWGVMAYELLSGRHPFAGSTSPQQLMAAHFGETPKPLASTGARARAVPPEVAALVSRCLAKDRADRPASATELVATLDGAFGADRRFAVPHRRMIAALASAAVVLAAVGTVAWRRHATSAGEATDLTPLVAVLPFETSGGGPGIVIDTSFADGLGDAITGKLSRLAGLRVIDRASVRSMRDAAARPLQTGRTLGAEYVLRAEVRWARGPDGVPRVRVSPTLVRVSNGTTRWAGEPTVISPADPFTIQGILATQVAEALDVVLAPTERSGLATPDTRDTAALAAVERGRRILREGAGSYADRDARALQEFEAAYRRDPHYADALGEAADAMIRRADRKISRTLIDSAAVLSSRALAIDPGQFQAVHAFFIAELANARHAAAKAIVERAVRAHPSSADLLSELSWVAQVYGDTSVAWQLANRALVLGPRSELVVRRTIAIAYQLRRYDDERYLIALHRAIWPSAWIGTYAAVRVARAVGDSDEVTRLFRVLRARGERPWLGVMNYGDRSLSDELLAATPATFDAQHAQDSVEVYIAQARAFMRRGDATSARAVVDRAEPIIRHAIAVGEAGTIYDPSRFVRSYHALAWLAAARGDAVSAHAALAKAWDVDPFMRELPGSEWNAAHTCVVARVEGLLGNVGAMLPPLRRCLTMPNGEPVVFLSHDAEFTRHRNDPRVRALAESLVPVPALQRPTQ